jgi:NitT/TauT family transport system substrate-binding protein
MAFVSHASLSMAASYKIGMIHWIAYSPLNVAAEKGFWKELGLDVEVINFGSNQELNAALSSKKIDIALDMMGSWVGMYMDGVPLTIVGETDWSHGGDKIIAKKDADLSKLKGSTVGVYLNKPSVTYFLGKYLEQNKLTLSDIKIVELEPETMADNFISDRFKVIVNYDPQALRAERNGNGVVAATSASWAGVIPEGFVMHSEKYQSMSKEDLEKVFKGWMKAVDWTRNKSNWAEYKKILNTKTFEGEKPYSDEDLKGMLGSVKIHDKATSIARNKNGGGLSSYLKDLKEFLKKNNLLTKDFQPEEIFRNESMMKALSK